MATAKTAVKTEEPEQTNVQSTEIEIPTMEEMAKEVNLAIKTLKDGTLPTTT